MFGDHQQWVVVCVISVECREISFSCVVSNFIKLCYVYGEHLLFADYGAFQILGLLRRNDGIKNQYAQGKAHCFGLPFHTWQHRFPNFFLT